MARIFFLVLFFLHLVRTQIISTNTPLPPLQWINLTGLLQGSLHPPPLKDAAIGYDETSRSIIIFGGESEGGFAQGQTFLLNLDNLSWSIPTPPSNLLQTPPARSAALAGGDFAASNRHAFVVVGGKGSDGKALPDVWAFDFTNQFWSPVSTSTGGPSPRWGASGGIDIRVAPVQDPVVPGPNNTFYLAGGTDGNTTYPLSEVWGLHLSGTLSSNLPNSAIGSWDRLSIANFPARVAQGSTVVGQQIISAGGCDTTQLTNFCARQDSFIVNIERRSGISPAACPAPRLGPALTPNVNTFSPSFASQIFMLLGTFDGSHWNDDDGHDKGEIAVLDINTGTWTRILPAGDPGPAGRVTFPSPREGASVLSFQMGLVGPSRNSSADTIVFGGRDSSGTYLSEVWLLRAYTGLVSPSQPQWEGFGDGRLQSGVAANGAGVEVQYLSRCASAISTAITTPTATPTSGPGGTTTPGTGPIASRSYDTSVLHKLLTTISLIILQCVILVSRTSIQPPLIYISAVIGLCAYGLGTGGFILAFRTIVRTSGTESLLHLQTGHGLAGLILFLCLYVFVPIWLLVNMIANRSRGFARESQSNPDDRVPEEQPDEKSDRIPGPTRSAPQSAHNISPPSSPRPRTQSWGPSGRWRRSMEAGLSSDSESMTSGALRAFEVVNRPGRHRQAGTNTGASDPPTQTASRTLGEIDWLLRRRSLNLVGELDYALTQTHNAHYSTPATADILLAPVDGSPPKPGAILPALLDCALHILIHAAVLGLSVLILVILWQRVSKLFFILFLVWTIAFYIALLSFAWNYRPQLSILSTIFFRLRNNPTLPSSEKSTSLPRSPSITHPIPLQNGSGPYLHHPPYRTAPTDEYSPSHVGPVEADDDDDMDEVTRQHMIEAEMDRRDVSIVTVPKRRLWVANPS